MFAAKDNLVILCISGCVSEQTRAYMATEHHEHSDITYICIFQIPNSQLDRSHTHR